MNIAGLSLGITSSLILFLLIRYATSYDNYHTKGERIYRVTTTAKTDDGSERHSPGVPAVLPDAFKNDFTEAEEVTFTSYRNGGLIEVPVSNGETKKFEEGHGIVFTEPDFFRIFDRKILAGSGEKSLDEPNEAIISKNWAVKFFGKEDPIGSIVIYDKHEYKISAVMENFPNNTDFPFEIMFSYVTIAKERIEGGWGSIYSDDQCYFLLKDGVDVRKIEARIPAFVDNHYGKDNWKKRSHHFQPLSDMHFDSRYSTYSYRTVTRQSLWAMGIVGIFLILTACINFVNLSTAEAIRRSREVGIRKTLGSTRSQLVRQFLGETFLVTVFAMAISLGLTQIGLRFLNPFMHTTLTLDLSKDLSLLMYIALTTVVVSILSGLYPAIVLSGYKPVLALKSMITSKGSQGYVLRRGLVVLQFFISQFFIIGTIVMIEQLDYFQNKDLGFDKEAIMRVDFPAAELTTKKAFAHEVRSLSGIRRVALAFTSPSSASSSSTGFSVPGQPEHYDTHIKMADSDYVPLYDLKIVAGRNLHASDTLIQVVVNETLVKTMGLKDPLEAVGKIINVWDKNVPIVGVVKDFHTQSLENKIQPVILFSNAETYGMAAVKIEGGNINTSIESIQAIWKKFFPDRTFDYQFLDQEIATFYESERSMSILLTIFTSMAIFIGCLGLFGLVTFMANQKTKEIGVRKVLGASVTNILYMFSKEFMTLIVIGFIIAAPLAWFVMNRFLAEFAYKIEIGAGIFLIGFGATLLIAILTVGFKSMAAANTNPVKALKCE